MSGAPTPEEFASAREKASGEGLGIIEPAPNLLLLDLDGFEALATNLLAAEVERYRSRGGKGWHVVVRLGVDLDAASRVALQAALGSDGFRELFAICLLVNGVKEPSMLFRPNTEASP